MRLMNLGIRKKLLIILLTVTLLPIVVSLMVSNAYTKATLKQSAMRENENLIFQGAENIMQYFDGINKGSLAVYNDSSYSDTLFKIIERGNSETTDSLQQIYNSLQYIYRYAEETESVALTIKKNGMTYLLQSGMISKFSGLASGEDNFAAGQDFLVMPPHKPDFPDPAWLKKDNDRLVISFHRAVRRIPSKDYIGELTISINLDRIRKIADQLYTRGEEMLYIVDRSGIVIFSPDPDEVGRTLATDWLEELTVDEGMGGVFEWDDDEFSGVGIVHHMQAPYLDWIMVKRIPYETLYKSSRQLAKVNALVVLASVMIAIVLTTLVAHHFTSPISRLVGYIRQVRTGNLRPHIEVRRSDEFGILEFHFKEMIRQIDSLIIQKYKLELASKSHQLKALQAQIDPHFIYNTLQSIGAVAMEMKAKPVYDLISSLGKMMRYSMNIGETAVPLFKEIEYVRHYLEFQKRRFSGELNFNIVSDMRADEVVVPKMILQPIVENYFKHGFKQRKPGFIQVIIRLAEDRLHIVVEDNGSGIGDERLEQIRRDLDQVSSGKVQGYRDIGLSNVLSKLRLFCDERAELHIGNRNSGGARVELFIPLEEVRQHEGTDRG